MTRIRAVVFDLDGTLCDTVPDIGESMNRAFAHVGLPKRPVREYEAFIGYGIRENMRRAAPEGTSDAQLEEAVRFYLADYPEHCADDTAEYPGITALLKELKRRGLAVAVVTNKTDASAVKVLTKLFPNTDFAFIWGRADGRPLKPSPELGKAVCDTLRLKPDEICYVGDGDPDVLFAKACGFFSVTVPWGYRSREFLKEAGAERFAETPAEILAFL